MTELAFSAALDDDDTAAMLPSAAETSSPAMAALDSEAATHGPAPIDHSVLLPAKIGTTTQPAMIDPTVAELCVPLSETDPCGPDLDLSGDADYLNFFAQTEGILPSSFFSAEDGRPFDRASVDLPCQIEAIAPLWERSRDLRLLRSRSGWNNSATKSIRAPLTAILARVSLCLARLTCLPSYSRCSMHHYARGAELAR